LVLTGYTDILPVLFGQIVIPTAVQSELLHSGTPEIVRQWIGQPPAWFSARAHIEQIPLALGEVEAISLAIEMKADLLLMDDRRARREAEAYGLSVTGTLNVLQAAAQRGLLDLPIAIAKLQKTNFHISQHILDRAIQEDVLRRTQKPSP
jgi:predicted nucleic acid-binding protein